LVKHCGKCGTPRPPESFYADRSKPSGLSSWCRDCTLSHRRATYSDPAQREAILERNRRSWHRTPEARRARYRADRQEMIDRYGGHCACCGEARPEFLTIDHVHNDGAAERATVSTASSIVAHLKRNGWPQDRYQLLCFNCNCAKGIHGRCPHEDDR
jgi:hypothetical protein